MDGNVRLVTLVLHTFLGEAVKKSWMLRLGAAFWESLCLSFTFSFPLSVSSPFRVVGERVPLEHPEKCTVKGWIRFTKCSVSCWVRCQDWPLPRTWPPTEEGFGPSWGGWRGIWSYQQNLVGDWCTAHTKNLVNHIVGIQISKAWCAKNESNGCCTVGTKMTNPLYFKFNVTGQKEKK